MSAKCRRKVGEVSVNDKLYRPRHIWNDYRPSVDPLSTDYRPTIDRYVDRLSTECGPSIDRLSTECRPTIDRLSTEYRPTVDRVSTAISTDISVDITHSKQDPYFFAVCRFRPSLSLFYGLPRLISKCEVNESAFSNYRV